MLHKHQNHMCLYTQCFEHQGAAALLHGLSMAHDHNNPNQA